MQASRASLLARAPLRRVPDDEWALRTGDASSAKQSHAQQSHAQQPESGESVPGNDRVGSLAKPLFPPSQAVVFTSCAASTLSKASVPFWSAANALTCQALVLKTRLQRWSADEDSEHYSSIPGWESCDNSPPGWSASYTERYTK